MKLHSHTVTLEGDPDEIIRVYSAIQLSPEGPGRSQAGDPLRPASRESEGGASLGEATRPARASKDYSRGKEPVSVVVARRVLSRLSISPRTKAVLQALYRADGRISIEDLRLATGCGLYQLPGTLGSLQKRINNTEGFDVDNYYFIDYFRDYEKGWFYGIPNTVKEAMYIEKLTPND